MRLLLTLLLSLFAHMATANDNGMPDDFELGLNETGISKGGIEHNGFLVGAYDEGYGANLYFGYRLPLITRNGLSFNVKAEYRDMYYYERDIDLASVEVSYRYKDFTPVLEMSHRGLEFSLKYSLHKL